MGIALRRLAEEDPTFQVEVDEALGQTKIRGMGELHLEVLVDRMMREYGVEANVGRPRVAYREAITRPSRIDTTFKRQTGGSGQYARVVIEFEPMTDEDRAEAAERQGVGEGVASSYTRSMIVAIPMPPPTQSAASPRFKSRASSSSRSVPRIIAPVAPSG